MENNKLSINNKTEVCKFQPGLQYVMNGDENQLLQFVLSKNKSILVHLKSIIWMSENLKIVSKDGFLAKLGLWTHIVSVKNESNDASLIGLSQFGQHGEIVIIKSIDISTRSGFYVRRINLLCSTEFVSIKRKFLPIQELSFMNSFPFLSGNNFYYCKFHDTDFNGGIFLQSGGPILKKVLAVGESILVNITNVTAIQDTCKINNRSILTPQGSIASSSILPIEILKVSGPGVVYFTSYNESSYNNNKKPPNVSSISLLAHLIAILLSISSIVLLFQKIFEEYNNLVVRNNRP